MSAKTNAGPAVACDPQPTPGGPGVLVANIDDTVKATGWTSDLIRKELLRWIEYGDANYTAPLFIGQATPELYTDPVVSLQKEGYVILPKPLAFTSPAAFQLTEKGRKYTDKWIRLGMVDPFPG